MKYSDLIFNSLHLIICFDHCLCRQKQLFADLLISRQILNPFFVTKLMLQRCPEIHSIGTDLQLHPHRCFALGKENRDFHDHMITAVAVWLGIFDIVFDLDDLDIIFFFC